MTARVLISVAILGVSLLFASVAEARKQVVGDPAGEHGRKGRSIDLKKVEVVQTGESVRFVLVFRHAGQRRSGVTINSRGRRYIVSRKEVQRYKWSDGTVDSTGDVRFQAKRRIHVFTFPLAAIGSSRNFEWIAWGMISHDVDDRVPNRGFKTFRAGKPGATPLPRRTIAFRGGRGGFVIDCLRAQRCSGTLTINKDDVSLIEPRRYEVRPQDSRRYSLKLTPAGVKALNRGRRVIADGSLASTNRGTVKFIAILKRK